MLIESIKKMDIMEKNAKMYVIIIARMTVQRWFAVEMEDVAPTDAIVIMDIKEKNAKMYVQDLTEPIQTLYAVTMENAEKERKEIQHVPVLLILLKDGLETNVMNALLDIKEMEYVRYVQDLTEPN